MTHRVVIRPAADRDLDEQAEYIARQSPQKARHFYEAVAETLESLARMPDMGSLYESNNPRVLGLRWMRVSGFKRHLIFYRPIAGGIEVIRVLYGSRDIESLLDVEGSE